MKTAADAAGPVTFTYDPVTRDLTNVAYPDGKSLTFSYDSGGRRMSMMDQGGFTVKYEYDAVGRLFKLKDGADNVLVTYLYDANGRLQQKTNGNATYTTYDYDANGKVLHLINYAPDGTVNSRFDDTYNSLGLKATETTLDGAWAYTYDAIGQLTHAVFASNNPVVVPNQDLRYNYDALGNRTSTVLNGVTTAYVPNNMNQYTSVGGTSYSYDHKGNLLSDGANTYAYNVFNKLVSVTGTSGSTAYSYNALGQRVSSTTGAQTTRFLIDPAGLGDVVGTYDGSGGLIARYTYGLGLAGQITGGTSYTYDFDPLGSTAGMSNTTGTYVDKYSYSPFGAILSSTGAIANPLRFVGQAGVFSDAADLIHMRARHYSVATGRFTSSDPTGLAGNDVNLYGYVGNSPNDFIDPFGTVGIEAWLFRLWMVKRIHTNWFSPVAAGRFLGTVGGVGLGSLKIYGIHPINLYERERLLQFAVRGGIFGQTFIAPLIAAPKAWYVANLITDFVEHDAVPWLVNQDFFIDSLTWLINNFPSGWDILVSAFTARDPNALYGPTGYGASNFVTSLGSKFAYRITYENFSSATAPAQSVTITNNLSASLDWTTFELTGIGFGDTSLNIPAGSQHFQATVPMTYNGQTFNVEMEAGIHSGTGQVYASFYSLDPNTGLPPANVLTGFLPPENGTGRGQGYVNYSISPKATVPTGAVIPNVAYITFDGGETIATNQVDEHDPSKGTTPTKEARVTIDVNIPTAQVRALAGTVAPAFNVSWSGSTGVGGSGIASYSVYVSTDGGATYTPWLLNTPRTSGTYYGVAGVTYKFYVVATSNVGNVQANAQTSAVSTQAINITASEFWRREYFGIQTNTGIAADTAIPDHDGIVNLLKYGLAIPTGSSGTDLLPIPDVVSYTDGTRLAVDFFRDPSRNDITLQVQAADTPAGPWTPVATSTNGAPFTGAGFVREDFANEGLMNVEVRDVVNVGSATNKRRFMRVIVTR